MCCELAHADTFLRGPHPFRAQYWEQAREASVIACYIRTFPLLPAELNIRVMIPVMLYLVDKSKYLWHILYRCKQHSKSLAEFCRQIQFKLVTSERYPSVNDRLLNPCHFKVQHSAPNSFPRYLNSGLSFAFLVQNITSIEGSIGSYCILSYYWVQYMNSM